MKNKILIFVTFTLAILLGNLNNVNGQFSWDYNPSPSDYVDSEDRDPSWGEEGIGGPCPCGVPPSRNSNPVVRQTKEVTVTAVRAATMWERLVSFSATVTYQKKTFVVIYDCIYIKKDYNMVCCACPITIG